MPELKLENSLVDGRYEVRERLGRGSYAEIFVARDRESDGKEVVIKALNTSLQGTPDADLERTLIENFQNEAIALDTVRHPHVILRWGHGTAADLRGVPFHYLVLECMPGGDLLRLCRERPGNALPLDDALYYFKQVCEALAFAHSKGIIHRDLKPNNFLLTADHLTLKIADFGVAKIATGEDTEITRVGADIYAPPEHNPHEESFQSERLTPSADIYSLAKSFYTVVCGRAPVQFKCDPIINLPSGIIEERWGRALLDVLSQATDDDPDKRYDTVSEFWNDLVQVAAIEEDDSVDEETVIKPRLKINPGAMPKTPTQPEFEQALASPGSHFTFTSATPVKPRSVREAQSGLVERLKNDDDDWRPSKFFIELQKPTPVEQVLEQSKQGVAPKSPGGGPGVKSEAKIEAKTSVAVVTDKFSETLRRRIFIVLLALAFLGLIVSGYNFVRGGGLTLGFGLPTEIEVTAPELNVRAGPNPRDPVLGVIAKGSKHKVLAQNERQWMQIEVIRWDETYQHANDQNRGWVNGNPGYVRVVSRRWW